VPPPRGALQAAPLWAADGGNGRVIDMEPTERDRLKSDRLTRLVSTYDLVARLPETDQQLLYLLLRAKFQGLTIEDL